MLFGRFLHHSPYFGLQGEEDRNQKEIAFAQTQTLFKKHFKIDLLSSGSSMKCDCQPILEHSQNSADCEPL